jgi:diguanylate cyclase (GGDEF)-like protein
MASLVLLVAVTAERPEGLDPLLSMPWWLLAGLFGVTEWSTTPLRIRGRVREVSFDAVPLVFGLFLAAPVQLLLGAAVGVGAVRVVRRSRGGLPAPWTTGLRLAQVAVAMVTVDLLLPDRPVTRSVAAAAATTAAVALQGLVGAWSRGSVQRWYGGRGDGGWAELGAAAVLAAMTGLPAVAAVLAFDHAEAALPLATSGSAALLGLRGYSALGRRQHVLERLYRFSDALAGTPDPAEVVRSVLVQSIELLHVGYAEVVLDGVEAGRRLAWTARTGQGVIGPVAGEQFATGRAFPAAAPRHLRPVDPTDRAVLALRRVAEAVLVPLSAGGTVSGHLLVADRRGEGRAFTDADLRLLVTVANHAGVALSNARLIERLHDEARHDELTGLPNRASFRESLDSASAAIGAGAGAFAVMLLDFDGFKAINDTLGHSAGDEVLRVIGARLAASVAGSAVVARLGGDEFAVLAPGCHDERDARVLARQLLAAFDQPVVVGDARLHLGGSLGVALAPRHATDATDLMRAADVAMYAAKAGAGGLRVFTEDLLELDTMTLTLGGDLRDALAGDEIEVVVHPLLVLATEELHSVEVLARWHHPVHGEVNPQVFFAAAEQAGLVAVLSARILEQALTQCRRWLDEGTAVRCAVNVAPRWLADEALPEIVGAALARHKVPAELLCLELTERSVIADPRRVTHTLQRLRALGVHLSVDDFGTGYSSLTYLSRLPVHQLKIDKSFVSRIADSERDLAIVRSLVDLGRHLGLEVVAEGVSNDAVRALLEEIGCLLAQGYLFATPFAPIELESFVTGRRVSRPIYQIGLPT